MIDTIFILSLALGLLAGALWLSYRAGRTEAEKRSAKASAKVKDKQIEAALKRPDRSDLIDRLRDGGF